MSSTYQYDQDFLEWQKQIQEELLTELKEEAELDSISIKLFGAPMNVLDEIFDYDEEIVQSAVNKIHSVYNQTK